jgi:hypothetical protein
LFDESNIIALIKQAKEAKEDLKGSLDAKNIF